MGMNFQTGSGAMTDVLMQEMKQHV
ncbi:hypothetical protein [uncultured Robinsoniella sp.]